MLVITKAAAAAGDFLANITKIMNFIKKVNYYFHISLTNIATIIVVNLDVMQDDHIFRFIIFCYLRCSHVSKTHHGYIFYYFYYDCSILHNNY